MNVNEKENKCAFNIICEKCGKKGNLKISQKIFNFKSCGSININFRCPCGNKYETSFNPLELAKEEQEKTTSNNIEVHYMVKVGE